MATTNESSAYRCFTYLRERTELRNSRGSDITLAQLSVLTYLSTLPFNPLFHDVVNTVKIHKSHLTRIIKQMERKGLVARISTPADDRTFRLELSSSGHELVRRIEGFFQPNSAITKTNTERDAAE